MEDEDDPRRQANQYSTPHRPRRTARQHNSASARSTQRRTSSARSRPASSRRATQREDSTPTASNTPTATSFGNRGMRFFAMPKQRVKAYWQFIVLVADERHAAVPDDALTIDHAKHGWCQRCNTKVYASKGRNDAGPHMNRHHVDAVATFRQREDRRRTQSAARRLLNIYDPARPTTVLDELASEAEQRRADDLLVEWIASSLRPLGIVHDPGFVTYIAFVNSVSGSIHVPSRQTVTTRTHIRASQLRSSLLIRIADPMECYFFSVSSDIWTSLSGESFISFTLHYVDANFNLNKWTLEVISIPGKHDAPAIAAALLRCFSSWSLDRDKCVRFLRDGASNITKACKDIGVASMLCVAHSLHLVIGAALMRKPTDFELTTSVDDSNASGIPDDVETSSYSESLASDESIDPAEIGQVEDLPESREEPMQTEDNLEGGDSDSDESIDLEEVSTICEQVAEFVQDCKTAPEDLESVRVTVRRFRKLAEYFHRSSKGTNRLQQLQGGRRSAVKVTIDSPTRWNSTMTMLQRLIRLRPALERFFTYLCSPEGIKEFDDVYRTLQAPTSEEWFVIQCLVKLLGPFSAVSDHLGGETYPTLVTVHASIRTLKLLLRDTAIFDDLYVPVEREPFADRVIAMMKYVRRAFVSLLEKRFEKMDDDLLGISLLDPYFTNSELLTEVETKKAKKRLEMVTVTQNIAIGSTARNQHEFFNTAAFTPGHCAATFQRVMYGSRLTARRSSDARSLGKDCDWELNNYLRTSSAERVKEQKQPSSLDWWRGNAKAFPRIAALARKWLGCIATSVPSERAFSTAGNTVTKRRSALTADTVRDIVFMAENQPS